MTTLPPNPFPGGGAPHPATDPARDTVGTVRRKGDNVFVHTNDTAPEWVVISGPAMSAAWFNRDELDGSDVIGAVPGTPASDSADVVTVRRDDVERTRLALQELEQWRTGSRITQESSDQQDRAIKAEHQLADTRHRLQAAEEAIAGMVPDLDDARAALVDAQESRQAWAIEADRCDQVAEQLRADLARAHQYIGGLLLADPARFPGSAEQAAARLVDLDPPPADLTARVQHAVTWEQRRG